jgi:hypothetical protein
MSKILLLVSLFATASCASYKKGKRFEHKDLNSDGKVSKEEWVQHSEKKFGKYDKNGDGSITMDEYGAKKCKKECGKAKKDCKSGSCK